MEKCVRIILDKENYKGGLRMRTKKALSVFLIFAIFTALLPLHSFGAEDVWDGVLPPADADAAYSGGSGSEDDPYIIATAADLAQLSRNTNSISGYTLGKYFKQTADIYLNESDVFAKSNGRITGVASGKTAKAWTPMGTYYYPFEGNYDGGKFAVKYLYVNRGSYDYNGLFGAVNNGTYIANVVIEDSYIKGSSRSGAVAGYNFDGTIANCINLGSTVEVSGESCGGIVGYNSSLVTNCYNAGYVTGRQYIGGIVGYNYALVENCYNVGEIVGSFYSGGVVGFNFHDTVNQQGKIRYCYNAGQISEGYNNGGVAGYSPDSATAMVDCYYLDTSIPAGTTTKGTALTDGQLRSQDSFAGFDFENVWIFDSSSEYPYPTLRVFLPVIAVTGVELNETEVTLIVGESIELTATVLPENATNKNIIWASSDEEVASVSPDGTVTALSEGTATITVTTEDGGFTAQCEVTVEPEIKIPEQIKPAIDIIEMLLKFFSLLRDFLLRIFN
jgi:hypothetical protein